MPVLLFPNSDALRLALASGIVPPEFAREPADGRLDDAGRAWAGVPAGFPKDALAALHRIGVTLLGPGTAPPLRPLSRWAELLPLRPAGRDPVSGPVLLELPDQSVAAVVAEIRRLRPQIVSVRLLPETRRAWVLPQFLPTFTIGHLPASGGTLFVEQAPRVWVEAGWQHSLPEHLAAPQGVSLLLRSGRDWEIVPDEAHHLHADIFRLHPEATAPAATPAPRRSIGVRLRLGPTSRGHESPTLWLLDGDPAARMGELADTLDERLLRKLRAAVAGSTGVSPRLLIRMSGSPPTPLVLDRARAFVPHPALPTLFLPEGYELNPALRPHALAELLHVDPTHLKWIVPGPDRAPVAARVAAVAFRPLGECIHHTCPPPTRLTVTRPDDALFRLPRIGVAKDPAAEVEPARDAAHAAVGAPPQPVLAAASEGWLTRSLNRLTERVFGGRSTPEPKPRKRAKSPTQAVDPEPSDRVSVKLTSRHTLVHGNEWTALRLALEQKVLTDLPRLPPAERVSVWAELAEVYAAVNQPADAALCWLNAVWDSPAPPAEWVGNWLLSEAKLAKIRREDLDFAALLRGPASPQTARVVAAALTWAAAQPHPPGDLGEQLPRLLARVEQHEAELPARAVWVAQLAAAKLAAGNALGLARCRDRVFQRLVEAGPGLDLDAPSFLRFRGGTTGDRFQTARDWLLKVRDPVHRWLSRLATKGRLQWAGLDPEAGCTTAYADLMLAWGLSRLGDRTRSKSLETQSTAVLERAGGNGVDPAVHQVLLAAFRDRIRAAQDGRPDRPGLPLPAAAELVRLDDLARYAVEKLRSVSGILEPIDLVNPYRGRDRAAFLGTDSLGERLARLLARPDLAPDPADVRGLLGIAEQDPTAVTLPRVVFALLEVAPRTDAGLVARVLPYAGKATELIPEWARLGLAAADPAAVANRFGRRLLTAACHAAGLFHLPGPFRTAVADLMAARGTQAAAPGQVFEPVMGRFFRTLRKLGLNADAAELLGQFQQPPDPPRPVGPRELGLAVGWYAVGDEDAGNRLLNAARDRLFVQGVRDRRDRTTFALAYAAALGHAPPGIALGRLEELFQRLDGVATHGATNRYFTLRPLELVDAVVRAVVSDDFALGPGVRNWLDDDEYLIRRRVTRDLDAALHG